jgi:UPF0716 protein FxsA
MPARVRIPIGKAILAACVALPLAEITVFWLVSANLGFFNAFFLLLAESAAGIALLTWYGKRLLAWLAATGKEGPAISIALPNGGLLPVLGAFLLALPGFLSGIAGIALLIPPVRAWIVAHFPAIAHKRSDGVVDLEDSEWRRMPDPRLAERPDRAQR